MSLHTLYTTILVEDKLTGHEYNQDVTVEFYYDAGQVGDRWNPSIGESWEIESLCIQLAGEWVELRDQDHLWDSFAEEQIEKEIAGYLKDNNNY